MTPITEVSVVRFRTSDGKLHDRRADAAYHQLEIDIGQWSECHFRGGNYSPEMIASTILLCRAQLTGYFEQYALDLKETL